jgi:hypothetical protein
LTTGICLSPPALTHVAIRALDRSKLPCWRRLIGVSYKVRRRNQHRALQTFVSDVFEQKMIDDVLGHIIVGYAT